MFPGFGALVHCILTVLVHRRLVMESRAVWRGMVYDGGVVGCRRCGGGGAVTVWWFDGM